MKIVMDSQSLDITAKKLKQLRAIFPEVFAEDKVDFARLKDVLGENVAFPNEHYELSWAGKAEARKEIQKQTTATLIPDKANSIDFDASQNIFIEGENLQVLRILQKSYFGKVKMIYIDPPYNTGNDSFVYPDDFAERQDEYKKRAGITDNEGYLNKQDLWHKNTRENGQFHSVWLSMMYPRLYLARNLLREDGVIFVSIDDNEVANLKLLMDDVFGEENLIQHIIWNSKYTVAGDATTFSSQHEHILCYARNSDECVIQPLPRTEEMDAAYKNPDNDLREGWKPTPLHAKSGNRNYIFTFKNGRTWTAPPGRWPRFSESTLRKLDNDNRIWFGSDGQSVPNVKTFLSEVKAGKTPGSVWKYDEVGHTHLANEQLASLLGKGVFDNPKPVGLVKRCLQLCTSEDDIVLDFFAGSGTTAQSVLELNEDSNNREFICVQMPEVLDENSEAYKASYRTIADICRARIRKVIEQMQSARTSQPKLEANPQSLGFQAFRLAPSNFKQWRGDVEGEDILKQLEIFRNSEKESSESDKMLYELLLKSGFPLTTQVETAQVSGQLIHVIDGGKLLAFFDGYDPAIKEYIHQRKPQRVVCLDRVFKGDDQAITNLKLELKEAEIELTII